MALTDFQSMYLAHKLTLRTAGNSVDKIAGVLADAQVELTPHQIDAALFAFQSPLSNGVILADEVGLGKTIEAGLVMSQLWAERKRRILVITPASLRKQWSAELAEKFFLPTTIMERQPYQRALRDGEPNPFETEGTVVITSYDYAKARADDIQLVPWDLVVMDEAHYLRNVYRDSSRTARIIRDALAGSRKLLLTATPLQNSLSELYGLVSVIDPHVFGDRRGFLARYQNPRPGDFEHLQQRLKPLAQRTLRRQVTAFIPYTRRIPLVQEFLPTDEEITLYDMVGDYLASDHLQALPSGQRHLMTLMLQKLQASSTFALAPTLERLARGLRRHLDQQTAPNAHAVDTPGSTLLDDLADDDEGIADLEEEAGIDDEDGDFEAEAAVPGPDSVVPMDADTEQAIRAELAELDTLAALAREIRSNAKGQALLKGLRAAFRKAEELGAPRKVIIFTEFRRTQDHILDLLQSTPEFSEGIVLFNGGNADPRSRDIYDRWLEANRGTGRISGSRTADTRQALVDAFRDDGQIMIATEAAAQGLNLQFCSLIINYDLPWNPQRIEQRIGRCHRYGQKFDVVVVNFLDKHNAADQRVYELLNEKYQLFQGVFGASDDVLGDIGAGIDLERRISEMYRTARTADAIERQFRQLQLDFESHIEEQMVATRARLFEHFDEEVADRLQVRKADSEAALDRVERDLMAFSQHELAGCADFLADSTFRLHRSPFGGDVAPTGLYALPRRDERAYVYRLGHPLAEGLISRAKGRRLTPAHVTFDYDAYGRKVSVLERLRGTSGWLDLSLLTLESPSEREEHLVVTAITDGGERLPADVAARLLALPAGDVSDGVGADRAPTEALAGYRTDLKQRIIAETAERHAAWLDEEADKLDRWVDDLRDSLDAELKELERGIREARRLVRSSGNALEKIANRRDLNQLETRHSTKSWELYQKNLEISARRDALYDDIEARLNQAESETDLFTIRWSVA